VAETTVKRFVCCGFRRTDKAMEQVNLCWWRIYKEINVFSRVGVTMKRVLSGESVYWIFTSRNYK
jgi:hypothetical protein